MTQIDRKDYIEFIKNHPSLVPMPKRLREDLEPLPNEVAAAPPPISFEDQVTALSGGRA